MFLTDLSAFSDRLLQGGFVCSHRSSMNLILDVETGIRQRYIELDQRFKKVAVFSTWSLYVGFV